MSDSSPTQMPYAVVGRGANAIVFIHGFLDGSMVWEDVIAALDPAIDATTIAVDLAGMGAYSHASGALTLERYAADVAAIVQELGRPVVLVGQSMGTQIAELVARAHPASVRGLVLVNPIPLGGVNAPEPVVAPLKALAGNADAQRQARQNLSFDMPSRALDRIASLGVSITEKAITTIVDVWNAGHAAGQQRSVFKGPVLLLRGGSDGFVDAAMAAATAARFDDLQQATIERAGHWVHLERPREVAELLSHFLIDRAHFGRLPTTAAGARDWQGAFADKSKDQFENAFAETVVLDATTLTKPVVGRENVGQVMAAASKIYEFLEFGAPTTSGSKQYLEWQARAFGGVELRGVTVITRDDAGKIAHVAIHHRPLGSALRFSQVLGQKLLERGALDPSYFFHGPHAASYLTAT